MGIQMLPHLLGPRRVRVIALQPGRRQAAQGDPTGSRVDPRPAQQVGLYRGAETVGIDRAGEAPAALAASRVGVVDAIPLALAVAGRPLPGGLADPPVLPASHRRSRSWL